MRLVRFFQLILVFSLLIPSGEIHASGSAAVVMSLEINPSRTVTVRLPEGSGAYDIQVDVENEGASLAIESDSEVVTYTITADSPISDLREEGMIPERILAITIY